MPSTWAQKIVKVLNTKLCPRFDSSSVWIPAMREVQRLVSEVGQIQQAVQNTSTKYINKKRHPFGSYKCFLPSPSAFEL